MNKSERLQAACPELGRIDLKCFEQTLIGRITAGVREFFRKKAREMTYEEFEAELREECQRSAGSSVRLGNTVRMRADELLAILDGVSGSAYYVQMWQNYRISLERKSSGRWS